MPHVLVLEDDQDIRQGLEQSLRRAGIEATGFELGSQALALLTSGGSAGRRLDAALLDLSLPDMDGLEVLRAIRSHPLHRALPVLLVTARAEEIDRVLGLELGADDYISKPFSTRELLARLQGFLRRRVPLAPEPTQELSFGPVRVDLDMHQAWVSGEALVLTRMEFELLSHFVRNPRRVHTRERLLQQVWGREHLGESRTVDAHVRRLRHKLADAAELIETVTGIGYRFGSVEA